MASAFDGKTEDQGLDVLRRQAGALDMRVEESPCGGGFVLVDIRSGGIVAGLERPLDAETVRRWIDRLQKRSLAWD